MKMFKKLMAVVLTGVMAVSMLTGCAFGDAAIGTAVEKALNAKETYGRKADGTVDSDAKPKYDFNYSGSLKSTAKKVWDDQLKNGTIVTDRLVDYTNNNTNYVYYVVERPSDDYKAAKGWKGANGKAQALYDAVDMKGVAHTSTTAAAKIYTPTTSTKTDVKLKVNFGVYSDKKTVSGTTTNYVVIIFKVAPVQA